MKMILFNSFTNPELSWIRMLEGGAHIGTLLRKTPLYAIVDTYRHDFINKA